jgi:uncharacterized protein (DUF2345 family)
MSTKDQMQDVFPIEFNFVEGEQPDGVKFTGWRKQTDAAFARITRAIGDPWEYNTHSGGSGPSNYHLSPSRLAQASLARIIGPADYASPQGGCWNEAITGSVVVTLDANRNSWRLGFPLKKKISTDMSPAPSDGYSSFLTDLVFDTDIILQTPTTSPAGEFLKVNRKYTLEKIAEAGDWHIDFDKGIITTYSFLTARVALKISNINMLGPGTPWGTANIIPSWSETVNLCNCTGSGTSWIITLPTVKSAPRQGISISGPEATYDQTTIGAGSQYRLPYSLTSSLSAGDEIPEGFIYLWDELTSRILPLITFSYIDEYSVALTTPDSWISGGQNYRIIITGTSLAENVNYLLSVVRDNVHSGLSNSQNGNTILFTNPISHDDLTDLYTGTNTTVDAYSYRFVKSSIPTNPHPQYLHRYGYIAGDNANTNNAMRGNLVIAGLYDSTSDTYPIGAGPTGGCGTETYALSFGGNFTTSGVAAIKFEGGIDSDTEDQLAFGLAPVGLSGLSTAYGALSIYQYYGTPLYLRGYGTTSNHFHGGSIAFDLKRNRELNYIKLIAGYRSDSTRYDVANLPAILYGAATGVLNITPDLSARLMDAQVREFRFRACSYNASATNTGVESSGDFSKHFTSPSIVGTDWLNLYSNAIFFSETGDGKSTSFTTNGHDWLWGGGDYPVGLYYEPDTFSGSFKFVAPTGSTRNNATIFSGSYSTLRAFNTSTPDSPVEESYIWVKGNASSYGVRLHTVSSDIYIDSGKDININSIANVSLDSGAQINISSTTNMSLDSGAYNIEETGSNIYLYPNNILYLGNSSTTKRVAIQALTSIGTSIIDGDVGIGANNKIYAKAKNGVKIESDEEIYINSEGVIRIYSDGDGPSGSAGMILTAKDGAISLIADDNVEIVSNNEDIFITAHAKNGAISINANGEKGSIDLVAEGSDGHISITSETVYLPDIPDNSGGPEFNYLIVDSLGQIFKLTH